MSLINSIVKSKIYVIRSLLEKHLDETQMKELDQSFEIIKDLAEIAARKHNLETEKMKFKLGIW